MYLSNLALTAPEEPSKAMEGLTNMQALLAALSYHDGSHFNGGTPFKLFYTDRLRVARVVLEVGPYMPNKVLYDFNACSTSSIDVSFNDHLTDSKIPVFFITSEGGAGSIEDYTKTLIQITDYTHLNVEDPEQPTELDFGHGDLWASFYAKEWVWEPLYEWLIKH